MTEAEFTVMAAHFAAGDRVDHMDGCVLCFEYGGALVEEVRRLRAGICEVVDRTTSGYEGVGVDWPHLVALARSAGYEGFLGGV